MKKLNKTLLIICLGLGMMSVKTIYACSHFAGGEITYSCVGKDSFLVKLTFYRECNGMSLPSISLGAKCAQTGSVIKTITSTKSAPIDISPVCKTSCTRCQSSSCSFPYGFEKYVYTYLFDLSSAGSCCEIIFSTTNCCRPCAATTYDNWVNYYYETKLNRCLSHRDNSPVFVNDPLALLCLGQDVVYSFAATDEDRDSSGILLDSLSYEIVPALQSATKAVTYTGQYTYDKPFYFWVTGFLFDPRTGNLSFRPMKVEQTVMAVKVTSWRNVNGVRVKISEITRDMHYMVISCPNNNAPKINASIPSNMISDRSIIITTNDYDTKDSLKLQIISNIPDLTYYIDTVPLKKPEARINFNNIVQNTNTLPYSLVIKVKDDACPVSGSNSRSYPVRYTAKPEKISIKDSVVGCNMHYLSIVDSPLINYNYSWLIKDKNPVLLYGKEVVFYTKGPGRYPIEIRVGTDNYPVYRDTIHQDSFLFLNSVTDKEICQQDSILIRPDIYLAQGTPKYIWSNGHTGPSLLIAPNKDTTLYFEISDSAGCAVYDTFSIRVKPLLSIKIDPGNNQYLCYNESFTIKPSILNDPYSNYSYDFYSLETNQLIAKAQKNITVNKGSFFIDIADKNYCAIKDTIFVYSFPEIKAYAPDQTVCPYENVVMVADTTGSKTSATIYAWYNQDSTKLLHSGQSMNAIADDNKVYKLIVKEWNESKYCMDETFVKLNRKATFFKPKIPAICAYDSFVDLSFYIDTTKSSIFTTHASFINGHFYNPFTSRLAKDTVLVTLHDYYSGCIYDSLFILSKFTLPFICLSNEYNKNSFCPEYGKIQLFASPAGGMYGGKWYGPVDEGKYFNTSRTPGNYTLVYEYRDNNGCVNSDSVILTVGHTAIAIDKSDSMICSGTHFQAKATFSFAQKMQWIYGSGSDGFMNGSIYNVQNTYVPGAGDKLNKGFTLYAKTIDPVCPETWDSIHVYIAAQPKADFSAQTFSGNPPLNVQFNDQTNIAYDYISEYLWDFGDGNKSTLKDPMHTYTDTGSYTVSLKVNTIYGCEDSIGKKKLIYVYPVSLDENNLSKISVYPNPAQDQLIIESTSKLEKVILYNFLGAKIRETEANNESKINLERRKLPSGLYLLKVYDKKGDVYVYQVVFK